MELILAQMLAVKVATFAEASQVYCERRDEGDFGPQDFPYGIVRLEGQVIGFVRYDGTVYAATGADRSVEVIFTPSEVSHA